MIFRYADFDLKITVRISPEAIIDNFSVSCYHICHVQPVFVQKIYKHHNGGEAEITHIWSRAAVAFRSSIDTEPTTCALRPNRDLKLLLAPMA